MTSRPYIDFRGQALRDLYKASLEDETVLTALVDELRYRNVPAMRILRAEVESSIRERKRQISRSPVVQHPHSEHVTVTSNDFRPASESDGSFLPESDREEDVDPSFSETDSTIASEEETAYASSRPHNAAQAIRPCGNLRDVPSRWFPPDRRDIELRLPESASRLEKFIAALRALVADMRRKGAGMRTITLQQGEAIELDGHEKGYRFPYDGDAELFEGAKVSIEMGGKTSDGWIVSVSKQWLIISLAEDFGTTIKACILRIDNTAMIEALAERLAKVQTGEFPLNLAIANNVLDNSGDATTVPDFEHDLVTFSVLNSHQKRAVNHANSNAVTYLWGPPGTGKTQTLGAISQLLFSSGKRILICSNTNQAVDQVLKKLCETFTINHPALSEGKVLRIGKSEGIPEIYNEYVTLDGIVRRKSVDLQARKDKVQDDLGRVRAAADSSRRIVDRFRSLDEVDEKLVLQEKRGADIEQSISAIVTEEAETCKQIESLERELLNRTNAGVIRRLLMRQEGIVAAELAKHTAAKGEVQGRLQLQRQMLRDFESDGQLQHLRTLRNDIRRGLLDQERIAAERGVSEAEERIAVLLREMSEIDVKLNSIVKSVISEAKILGATVTKTFLSPQQFEKCDVVIIDEASMVILPALYFACGLAKERVIISGDFRQLPPIISTEQRAINEVIGSDVFNTAGIPMDVSRGIAPKRTVMLSEQYRMTETICSLISGRMYSGKLKTSKNRLTPTIQLPAPFDGEMTIIDTSSIQPFVTRYGNSRYNLVNALAVRNLVRYLKENGILSRNREMPASADIVGICTPFAAQKDLLKRLTSDSGVVAGTVHRYQGDERVAMVIDIPDSLGERFVSLFAQAGGPDEAGAQLFNVAVSRAQAHIIFIANLEYLDRKLPADAFLRDLLYMASKRGNLVDVRAVIAMWPIIDDLREQGYPFDLDPSTLSTGLFNESSFEGGFRSDIDRAKRGVVIYSGFVTPQKVGSYEALFRRKAAEGVDIRCVTRPPSQNGSIPRDQGKDALNGLEAMGCTVDTRWEIHQKVVIIDDEIIWFGSLNPLSHAGRTDEMMIRIVSKPAALQMAAFLCVGGRVNPDNAEGIAFRGENPRCPACEGRTTYRMGKWGPYWQCEDGCGWTESLKARGNRPSVAHADGEVHQPQDGPPCPKCKGKTVQRRGMYGQFWGCSRYPACDGLIRNQRGGVVPRGRSTAQRIVQD